MYFAFQNLGPRHLAKLAIVAFLAANLAVIAMSHTAQAKAVTIGDKLRLCAETYEVFWLPLLGNDRDFCRTFEKDGDVGIDRGVQWDVIDVLHAAAKSLARTEHTLLRQLASDLAQCVATYPEDGRASAELPDWCLVTPSAGTRIHFNRAKSDYKGTTAQYSLPDVLEAADRVWHHSR